MFQKATKENCKARIALSGPSGSGKTLSALRIASGMGKKIAFIDTEFRTASKYAPFFDFDVVNLSNTTPVETFIKAINFAGENGYEVLIIDTMSHVWDSLLDIIERVAKAKYNGNTFAAWKDKAGGKLQIDFTNSFLKSPCHIIACFRVKTDWVMEENEKGKMCPKRVGLGIKQREGIEYEFDMLLEGNVEHFFTCTKERSWGSFQDKVYEKPDENLGKEIIEWLAFKASPKPSPEQLKKEIIVASVGFKDIDGRKEFIITDTDKMKFHTHSEEIAKTAKDSIQAQTIMLALYSSENGANSISNLLPVEPPAEVKGA